MSLLMVLLLEKEVGEYEKFMLIGLFPNIPHFQDVCSLRFIRN